MEPFWSYQLNSPANPANTPQRWGKWAGLAVLFSWQLQSSSPDFIFFDCPRFWFHWQLSPQFFAHNKLFIDGVIRMIISPKMWRKIRHIAFDNLIDYHDLHKISNRVQTLQGDSYLLERQKMTFLKVMVDFRWKKFLMKYR